MVLTSYDDIINALTSGKQEKVFYYLTSTTTKATGIPHFLWRAVGFPGSGSVPATGAGTVPTSATAGALVVANPTAPDLSYFTKFGLGSQSQSISLLLIDVLWFNSALSGTVATAQTINSSALTRYTTGDGVYIGLVCWTATGTTASNVTVSYTNQAGTAGRTTPSVALWTGGWGGSTLGPVADQFQGLPLQAGDSGVRSIQTLTLSASTLTAGSFGAMLYKPIATITSAATAYSERDLVLQTPGLIQKQDSACLQFILVPGAAAVHNLFGFVETVEG